ncbi:MAG: ADP-ribosylglycohydrolase family protein [Candidatus Cloacimonetes bacterium]|nr:ADP-ribosylglycohydrolase family protein [Candidatus Cloacimonadota bacterium]
MSRGLLISKTIIYGVAVGDALGFPYQFIGRKQRISNPVIDMGISIDNNGNKHYLDTDEIGLWSDDTSLTLCLAESLKNGYDLKDIAERFILWLEKGYLSAADVAFDEGIQTTKAIHELKDIIRSGKKKLLEDRFRKSSVNANGNGALMRILPLVTYINEMTLAEQFKIVQEVSALTHPHIRSTLCCFLYLRIASRIIDKQDLAEAIETSQTELNNLLAQNNSFMPALQEEDQRELHRLLHTNLSCGEIDPYKKADSEIYISSSGYVIHTLEAALWCLLNSSSYSETILKAVNLGNDTDTVAAVAGGLAALYFGYENIPEKWIRSLKKQEIFEGYLY